VDSAWANTGCQLSVAIIAKPKSRMFVALSRRTVASSSPPYRRTSDTHHGKVYKQEGLVSRLDDLNRFYEVLKEIETRIGGPKVLSQCDGRMLWTARGIYFFFESGELRSNSQIDQRVVRVGTHALTPSSRTTLWNRLSQHRGTVTPKGGNHRTSIFRLLVGAALLRREGVNDSASWGQGNSADAVTRKSELAVEERVSTYIGGMPFLWLAVDEPSGADTCRRYIERNSIALLSNNGKPTVDPPSFHWLGRYCPRDRVQRSGLWNQNHVEKPYDPRFLDTLERLVSQMRL
jgi:hypothetical protein